MAVKIRCRRTGANNNPCFRVVAADSRSPQGGKHLETLGWYDPKKKDKNFYLKMERIVAWQQKGAQASEMVKSLIRKAGQGLMAENTSAVPSCGDQQSAPDIIESSEAESLENDEKLC